MGRPRYYWYNSVKKIIMQYPRLKDDASKQAVQYVEAIEIAIADTKKLENGNERMTAIDDILFKKTRTIDGVAIKLNYHWRTIQNWITDFIKLVGKKVGF